MIAWLKLLAHGLHGVWIGATRLCVLPPQARARVIEAWAQRTLQICGVRLEIHGNALPTAGALLVANHVSWLDIEVIHAWHAARFVAKHEINRWPLIGHLARAAGTLFLKREKRADARRLVGDMVTALQAGQCVVVFAEGTTSNGKTLLPFHANLLHAAVVCGAPVQPLAISYRDRQGRPSEAPVFGVNISLFASIRAVLRARPLVAHLVVAPAFAAPAHRRGAAHQAQAAVQAALDALDRRYAPRGVRFPGDAAQPAQTSHGAKAAADAAVPEVSLTLRALDLEQAPLRRLSGETDCRELSAPDAATIERT